MVEHGRFVGIKGRIQKACVSPRAGEDVVVCLETVASGMASESEEACCLAEGAGRVAFC